METLFYGHEENQCPSSGSLLKEDRFLVDRLKVPAETQILSIKFHQSQFSEFYAFM